MPKYCLWVRAKDAEGIRTVREALTAARCTYDYLEIHDPFSELSHVTFIFTGKVQMVRDGVLIEELEKPIGYDHVMELVVKGDHPPQEFRHLPLPRRCPSCEAQPGSPHFTGCEVERCSACGDRGCDCEGHDPLFARWTGFWPGRLEATALGMNMKELAGSGLERLFAVKPPGHEAVTEGRIGDEPARDILDGIPAHRRLDM